MNNQQSAFVGDRIHKITEALYRVTDLLPDQEPLKWEIRTKAVNIFNSIVLLKDSSSLEKYNLLKKIERLVDQLNITLSLFSKATVISGINFEILKEEYGLIRRTVSRWTQKEELVQQILPGPNGQSNGQQRSIGQSGFFNSKKIVKAETPNKEINVKGVNKNTSRERKDKIFGIVREKGQVAVGELSNLFPDYSEKTVQRDLIEMVEKGKLRKEGEKRWRRYVFDKNS